MTQLNGKEICVQEMKCFDESAMMGRWVARCLVSLRWRKFREEASIIKSHLVVRAMLRLTVLAAFVAPVEPSISGAIGVAHADSYRIDPKPTQSSGTAPPYDIPFDKPADSEVCKTYLANLRYFAKTYTPMSCERPIAPRLKGHIQKMEWEDLDPDTYPDLFRAVAGWKKLPEGSTPEAIAWRRKQVLQRHEVFRRAKMPPLFAPNVGVSKDEVKPVEPFHIVEYGVDTTVPNRPATAQQCKSVRGGPPGGDSRFDHKFFVVAYDMKQVRTQLTGLYRGDFGENLLVIDGRVYAEGIKLNGILDLYQLTYWDAPPQIYLQAVCRFLFKQSDYERK